MNPEDSAYWWLGHFEGVIANLVKHPSEEAAQKLAEDVLEEWEQARERGRVFRPDFDSVHEVTG